MMSTQLRDYIDFELKRIHVQHDLLVQARRTLQHWEEGKPYSVLGILDLAIDYTTGVASQFVTTGMVTNPVKALSYLKGLRPFDNVDIVTWYMGEESFVEIKRHLRDIDHFRLQLVAILEDIYFQQQERS